MQYGHMQALLKVKSSKKAFVLGALVDYLQRHGQLQHPTFTSAVGLMSLQKGRGAWELLFSRPLHACVEEHLAGAIDCQLPDSSNA